MTITVKLIFAPNKNTKFFLLQLETLMVQLIIIVITKTNKMKITGWINQSINFHTLYYISQLSTVRAVCIHVALTPCTGSDVILKQRAAVL